MSTNSRQLVLIPVFIISVALAARVSLPMPIVDLVFTLQTVVIFGFYAFMNKNFRFMSIGLYLTLGIIGLPIFSEGGSGWDHFTSESLGYFIGFALAAFVPIRSDSLFNLLIYFVFCHLLCILAGTITTILRNLSSYNSETLQALFIAFVLMFATSVIKSLVGASITYFMAQRIKPQ